MLGEAEAAGVGHDRMEAAFRASDATYSLKDNAGALRYLRIALHEARLASDTNMLRRCYRYIGGVMFEQFMADSAVHYLNLALDLAERENNSKEMASASGMLGETWLHSLNDTLEGERYHRLSLRYAEASRDSSAIGFACMRLGANLAARTGGCPEGLALVERALEAFRSINDLEGMGWGLLTAGDLNNRCGDAKRSFALMKEALRLKDAVFQAETARNTARYHELYETGRKERELAVQRERNLRNMILSGVLLVSIALLATVLLQRYRHRMERARARDRERIARELHDSIGSGVSYIGGKLDRMIEGHAADPALREDLHALRETSTELMSGLRDTLWTMHAASITNAELADRVFAHARKHLHMPMEAQSAFADESVLPGDAVLALFRAAQELLNNANKHSGASLVTLEANSDNSARFKLRIADNGCGYDAAAQHDGFGLQGLHARLEEIDARLSINSKPGNGTSATITYPASA